MKRLNFLGYINRVVFKGKEGEIYCKTMKCLYFVFFPLSFITQKCCFFRYDWSQCIYWIGDVKITNKILKELRQRQHIEEQNRRRA